MTQGPRTLFRKVWDAHLVSEAAAETPAVLYVDLHLVHEVTSPQAFQALRERGLGVRRPDRTVATMDHSTPTTPRPPGARPVIEDPQAAAQVRALEENCRAAAIPLFPLGHDRQGIVHVISPELGLTQPGMTIVCGDSHTSTHGAFGALAFGIGTSEVAHVLATQCLLAWPPKTLAVTAAYPVGSSCGGTGLAQGPFQRLLVACSFPFIVNAVNGSIISNVTQVGSGDEVWYNAGDGQFYVTSTDSSGATVLGVIDGQTGTWRQNVAAPGARNVAALASNNHIFTVVRSPAAGVTDTTLCTRFGMRDTGCVGVFTH